MFKSCRLDVKTRKPASDNFFYSYVHYGTCSTYKFEIVTTTVHNRSWDLSQKRWGSYCGFSQKRGHICEIGVKKCLNFNVGINRKLVLYLIRYLTYVKSPMLFSPQLPHLLPPTTTHTYYVSSTPSLSREASRDRSHDKDKWF